MKIKSLSLPWKASRYTAKFTKVFVFPHPSFKLKLHSTSYFSFSLERIAIREKWILNKRIIGKKMLRHSPRTNENWLKCISSSLKSWKKHKTVIKGHAITISSEIENPCHIKANQTFLPRDPLRRGEKFTLFLREKSRALRYGKFT